MVVVADKHCSDIVILRVVISYQRLIVSTVLVYTLPFTA